MPKFRLGIFGGTFNPPHIGHVRAAEAFFECAKLDKLLIMPDHLPPHKSTFSVVDASDRLEMCKLAFGHIKNTEISDFEIERGGKSYTAVTLKAFKNEDTELYFLCGTDMFLTLESWYEFETIFKLAVICCVRRENDTNTEIESHRIRYEEKYGARIINIPLEVTELSSTTVRNKIKNGEGENTVPELVADYIDKRGLYAK